MAGFFKKLLGKAAGFARGVGPAGWVSTGASLLGGAMAAREAKKQTEHSDALQREFAQHGIRWRVEDAKAAGLHPLYALGAQVPSYQPSYSTDTSMGGALNEAGQNLSRAMTAQQTSYERERQNLELQALQSQIAESDARRLQIWSDIALAQQAANGSAPFPGTGPGTVDEALAPFVSQGQVQVTPNTVGTMSAGDKSVGAGEMFAWRPFNIGPDFQMLLPGGPQSNIEESLESVSESIPLAVAVLAENMRRNPNFTEEAVRHYLGPRMAEIYKFTRRFNPGYVLKRGVEALGESYDQWDRNFRQLNQQ